MTLTKNIPAKRFLAALPLMCLFLTRPLQAYVDLAPTLSKIFSQSRTISLVEVESYDHNTHTVTLKVAGGLKGDAPLSAIKHVLQVAPNAATPRPVAQWASPGSRGVLFSGATVSLLCYGTGWYQVQMTGGSWKLDAKERPDLPLAFYGKVSRLSDCIEAMAAGGGSVISVVAFGADSEGASFDLALNRQSLPGIVRLQRIRASVDMPQSVASASSNPAYFIGPGEVDERDLPALMEKLKSPDAMVRAEAADDLRLLGKKAHEAVPALTALLKDSAPRTRFAAAAALLRITPSDTQCVDVLAQGLDSKDAAVRQAAASAAGFSGPAAGPVTGKLAGLLKDSDENVRMTALVSISMLGPVADKAVTAVMPLLDNPEMAIDAADALGRIGAAARPALPRLTQMLASDQKPVQWAAVRAMAQIGGPEAHPAVDFMVKAMPSANEVDGYNMMIYLSLLGPVAADAAPAIQSFRIKNPVLPSSTMWALAPEKSFPWQGNGGRGGRGFGGGPGGGGPGGFGGGQGGPGGNFQGGPGGGFNGGQGPGGQGGGPGGDSQGGPGGGFGGGPGGGGPGGGGFNGGPGGGGPGGGFGGGPGGGGRGGPGGGGMANISELIYIAYVHELGARLRPVSPILATKIMEGTAGEVPTWGYKILAAGPDLSLEILTPYLADSDLLKRERAAVALGYMGDAAAPAKAKITAALSKAPTEREQKLLQWCLREISED